MEQYVIITVGDEQFGIKIEDINEIIKMKPIIEVPNAHEFVEGVINLRGKIVPVVSLSKRIDQKDHITTKQTRIVVANYKQEVVGLIVDKLSKVTFLDELEEVPEVVGKNNKELFDGIAQTDIGIVSILNIEQVLKVGGE